MATFQFQATWTIEADTEEEAKDKFADASWDFAASADCTELEDKQ